MIVTEGDVRGHAGNGVVVSHADKSLLRELGDSTSAVNEVWRDGVNVGQ